MAKLDQNSAEWNELLDAFVQHAQIDTHFSCGTSSAFEVDELLLSTVSKPVRRAGSFYSHHQMAMRLGIIHEGEKANHTSVFYQTFDRPCYD